MVPGLDCLCVHGKWRPEWPPWHQPTSTIQSPAEPTTARRRRPSNTRRTSSCREPCFLPWPVCWPSPASPGPRTSANGKSPPIAKKSRRTASGSTTTSPAASPKQRRPASRCWSSSAAFPAWSASSWMTTSSTRTRASGRCWISSFASASSRPTGWTCRCSSTTAISRSRPSCSMPAGPSMAASAPARTGLPGPTTSRSRDCRGPCKGPSTCTRSIRRTRPTWPARRGRLRKCQRRRSTRCCAIAMGPPCPPPWERWPRGASIAIRSAMPSVSSSAAGRSRSRSRCCSPIRIPRCWD